jgi:chorismate mutase
MGHHRPPATENRSPAEALAVDRLLDVMQQRLLIMHEVAGWKWNTQQPIADPEREQAFLKAILAKSQSYRLDPALTRAFFQAQIEAAKQLQQDNFRW